MLRYSLGLFMDTRIWIHPWIYPWILPRYGYGYAVFFMSKIYEASEYHGSGYGYSTQSSDVSADILPLLFPHGRTSHQCPQKCRYEDQSSKGGQCKHHGLHPHPQLQKRFNVFNLELSNSSNNYIQNVTEIIYGENLSVWQYFPNHYSIFRMGKRQRRIDPYLKVLVRQSRHIIG